MRLLLALSLLVPEVLLAAPASTGGGIPNVVYFQAFNFLVTLGLLVYFGRKKIAEFFTDRKNQYLDTVQRVERLRIEVEKQNEELKTRLHKLETTADSSVEKAHKEAKEFQEKILGETKAQAQRLKTETQKTVQAELDRAIQILKTEAVLQIVNSARENVQSDIKDSDHERLKQEFKEKISVVEK